MIPALRALGLDQARWARLGPASLWPATAMAVGASVLISFGRFGGLIVDAPRSFTRLTLVGVWGWLGFSLLSWLIATRPPIGDRCRSRHDDVESLQRSVVLTGYAHLPLLVLGLVVFVSANLLQILGPGFVAAVFVLGFWFPASLIMATRRAHRLTRWRGAISAGLPYSVWLLVVGRHLLGQIRHLL